MQHKIDNPSIIEAAGNKPKIIWVQYSTPDPEGAEYMAVCLPAFSPEIVHRDE